MAKTCGRPTKVCATCRHHLRCHDGTCRDFKGPRPACKDATGKPCHTFTARPCDSIRCMLNGACKAHGGKNPSGQAHWNYQGKGFSSLLPKRMQQDYLDARANPDRLSLEDEIAELRALRADIWRAMDVDMAIAVGAVRGAAADLHKAYQAAFLAQKNGNAEKFAEAMQAIGNADDSLRSALDPVIAFEEARQHAADLVVKTEKLLRTENTIKIAERGMVSLEAALADRHTLVMVMLAQVDKHVADEQVQKAIRRGVGAEYARLTARRDTETPPAVGGVDVIDAEHSETAN